MMKLILKYTREEVPLVAYSPSLTESTDLGTRLTFADLGQTIMNNFDVGKLPFGTSFLNDLK